MDCQAGHATFGRVDLPLSSPKLRNDIFLTSKGGTLTDNLGLSAEDKRQAVYSSLVRYAAEAIPLRERALRRVVLGSLLGSSNQSPYRIGRIQSHITFGSEELTLRTQAIQETLDGLITAGQVKRTTIRERHAYYLTDEGESEVQNLIAPTQELFDEVTDKLFTDISTTMPVELATTIFRRFVFEGFSRFGRAIARSVTGTATRDDLADRVDTRAAFEAAIDGSGLSNPQKESLQARCFLFLASTDPVYDRLKLHISQGYYVTQLLDMDNAKFNPLANHAFSGSILYLDTNVLMAGLLYVPEESAEFTEVLNIARRLGITLRVTRVCSSTEKLTTAIL